MSEHWTYYISSVLMILILVFAAYTMIDELRTNHLSRCASYITLGMRSSFNSDGYCKDTSMDSYR